MPSAAERAFPELVRQPTIFKDWNLGTPLSDST